MRDVAVGEAPQWQTEASRQHVLDLLKHRPETRRRLAAKLARYVEQQDKACEPGGDAAGAAHCSGGPTVAIGIRSGAARSKQIAAVSTSAPGGAPSMHHEVTTGCRSPAQEAC